jgi:PadR family transcriptional regulator PadR
VENDFGAKGGTSTHMLVVEPVCHDSPQNYQTNFFITNLYNEQLLVPPFVIHFSNKAMIETRIGDFEEVVMLILGILPKGEAYAFRIAKEFSDQTGRNVSIGAIHSTLDRLDKKGFVTSELIQSSGTRGERQKRIFSVTALGKRILKESLDFKVGLWKQHPAFAGRFNFS